MMAEGPSVLSLMTAGLYVVVVLCCALAARAASAHRQLPTHGRTWVLAALLFAVLALLRVFALEELWRNSLRAALYLEGAYDERRSFQKPIVAAIVAIASGLAFWWVYRFARIVKGRRNMAVTVAQSFAFAMVVLLVLRLISLHAIDALLYGALKINWLVDIGSSLIVGASAVYYWKLVSGKQ